MSKELDMNQIKVGIVGGAGYTAGELIRILLYHPNVSISYIHSSSNANRTVSEVHPDLVGETELAFVETPHFSVDCIFLCMGHGKSTSFLEHHTIPEKVKIIDLSRDFRLKFAENSFVYGLPELNKSRIKAANKVANCGCFATAIQLALLPLAKHHLLDHSVHIHALTGSTGAGQKPSTTTHFSWRNNNVSIYKPFRHQHLDEIRQSILQLQPHFKQPLRFLPLRGNWTRGIFASAYTTVDLDFAGVQEIYHSFFADHPFVVISTVNPNLKQVVNTNKCILYLEEYEDQLLIISIIDNLVKGASGQAVQNMNLIFGLDETLGLRIKANAF